MFYLIFLSGFFFPYRRGLMNILTLSNQTQTYIMLTGYISRSFFLPHKVFFLIRLYFRTQIKCHWGKFPGSESSDHYSFSGSFSLLVPRMNYLIIYRNSIRMENNTEARYLSLNPYLLLIP